MMDTNIAKRETGAVQRNETAESPFIYVPHVDIRENKERIRLWADMPGVDPKSVDVSVEHNVLTVEGQALMDVPDGYQMIGQEYVIGKYRRDFRLFSAIDTDGIKARVNQGVLEVTLPKRDQAKTRKISIEN